MLGYGTWQIIWSKLKNFLIVDFIEIIKVARKLEKLILKDKKIKDKTGKEQFRNI